MPLYRYWIAFGLLAILGGKMIHDSLAEDENEVVPNTEALTGGAAVAGITAGVLFAQGVSTSIDALAVGVL